ncbi:MAG TPA: hypothetical protein ENO18_00870, partial [Caldithrix sp.]|nr:hypothetical protein [Caldithrix sp.]
MKYVSSVVLFLFFFSLFTCLWGNDINTQRLTFQFKNKPLRIILQKLSDDHQLNFIFNDTLIDNIEVTCTVQDETLNSALKKILNICQLSYEFISQNTIIIRRRDNHTKAINIINGTVCDAETGLPLVYANAYIRGRLIGSSTDTLGNFTLKIPSDSTMQLTVNYIGYETETKQIGSRSET